MTAFCPTRARGVSEPTRPSVRSTLPSAGFPLAAPLPSVDSTGVTRVFADFFGTMDASEPSGVCDRGLRLLPSRGCRSPAIGDAARPRSPGSRAEDMCERAEPFDSGRADGAQPTLLVASVLPSVGGKTSASPNDFFRSSIARPARAASYASPPRSPREAQGLALLVVSSCQRRT